MPSQFMPLDYCVFCYAYGSLFVVLPASKLLMNPWMAIGRELQVALWLPLFDCSYQPRYAVLATVEIFFTVFDYLADLSDDAEVVTHHDIHALGSQDAVAVSVLECCHLGVRQQNIRSPVEAPDECANSSAGYLHLCMRSPIQRITGTAMLLPIALYRGLSGVFGRISVQPSGKPCKRSHSTGVSLRTAIPCNTPPI